MEPITWALGSIAIAAITAGVTRSLSNNKLRDKVDDKLCNERREACVNLNESHFKDLGKQIEGIAENVKFLVRNNNK